MKNDIEIYFFSGTGNTLLLAKELKKRIHGTVLIPIAALKNEKEIVPNSKKIGFCFPNHGGQIPMAMKLFIQKMKLVGDEYLFAFVSSGGTGCDAFSTINKIVKKKNLKLSGAFLIQVPSFNPKTDDLNTLPSRQDLEDFNIQIHEKLDKIGNAIRRSEKMTYLDATPYQLPLMIKFMVPVLFFFMARHPSLMKDYMYADSKCTGCGICEQVCQTERISIQNSQPKWNPKNLCYACNACLAFCPVGAIQVTPKLLWAGSKTKENPRFKPPYASAEAIARQKYEKEYKS